MVGTAERYQYILRDESLHLNFGIDVINQTKAENPRLLSTSLQDEVRQMLHEACAREVAYGRDTIPRGRLGLNAGACAEFITNRRCAQLGLAPLFPTTENPFPWMSEAMDLKREQDFFETRVMEYQTRSSLKRGSAQTPAETEVIYGNCCGRPSVGSDSERLPAESIHRDHARVPPALPGLLRLR